MTTILLIETSQHTVENIGGLRTPVAQPILCGLLDNEWVNFNDAGSVAVTTMPSGAVVGLERALPINVSQKPDVFAIGPAFMAIGELDHKVNVTRVNQTFRTTDAQVTPFLIEVGGWLDERFRGFVY